MSNNDTFYFCRLVPPRPTFAMDMNDHERALMQQHAAYWRAKMDEGKVIAFGPVADPQGPWGLGILKLSNDAELKNFCDNDPVIKANIGMHMESLPMLRAVVKN